MRPRIPALLLSALLAIACGAAAARAADDDPATRDAKAKIEYFEKYVSKVKDDGKYADLVMELAQYPHALTVERIGKILLRDRDEEHQLIAAAALSEFKAPDDVRDAAGKVLVKGLQSDPPTDVLDTCIDSIGKIDYKDAIPVLNEIALGGGDPYVLLTTVRTMGRLNDRRALPALLELWERTPVGYKWETGEVKVDTGASGTADADAAKAQWEAKYGSSMGHHKKPPVMFKVYIQELIRSVRKITGDEKIEAPNDLRVWMEARREELEKAGIQIPRFKGTPPPKSDEKDKKGKDKK